MANSITAIINGINFQEAIFWWQASLMLDPTNNVTSVTWEDEEAIGFDDVVVKYKERVDPSNGYNYYAEYIQVKHHADKSGYMTVASFTDPTFIGATSNSLLQKLHSQYKKNTPSGINAKYIFFNTWSIDPDDIIGKLIGNGGMIRLELLFDNRQKSKMANIRRDWCSHLSINETELKELLQHLRIRSDFLDINTITDLLNPSFKLVKMVPYPLDKLQTPYIGLVTKLKQQKRNVFTAEQLKQICISENLYLNETAKAIFKIGIRTFISGAENMESESNRFLCLSHLYEDRKIKNKEEWRTIVNPTLKDFINEIIATNNDIEFSLDTHLSIAFASGYALDPKSGKTVSVIQKTKNGKFSWAPNYSKDLSNAELYKWETIEVNPAESQIAIAISITHQVIDDVIAFVSENLKCVGRIFHASVLPGPSFQAIEDGDHAVHLAQYLCQRLNAERKMEERFQPVHMFMAAPNAFSFFMGQYSKSIGKLVLYELANFPPEKPGDYIESLSFPHKN